MKQISFETGSFRVHSEDFCDIYTTRKKYGVKAMCLRKLVFNI
jgi:hypothetical protein